MDAGAALDSNGPRRPAWVVRRRNYAHEEASYLRRIDHHQLPGLRRPVVEPRTSTPSEVGKAEQEKVSRIESHGLRWWLLIVAIILPISYFLRHSFDPAGVLGATKATINLDHLRRLPHVSAFQWWAREEITASHIDLLLDGEADASSTSQLSEVELVDLATVDAGLRINSSLTSISFQSNELFFIRAFRTVVESLSSPEYTIDLDPASVLSATTSPNTCWPIAGSHGTVGIRLPRLAQLISVTVQFTASQQLQNHVGLPGRFRVWNLISPDDRPGIPAQCRAPASDFPSNLIPLLDGLYPVLLHEWRDDTTVSTDALISPSPCSISVHLIIVEIWGSHEAPYTCINRIYLHGF